MASVESVEGAGALTGETAGIFDREHTIAKPGFNRWLVPPAALCIHLCIGMAYGFSVFWLPLSKAIGIKASVACPDMGLEQALITTSCDWRVADLGWMFTLFFVFLGLSAAVFGGWVERVGPRKTAVVAAFCWCGGLVISALGVWLHQLWLMWLLSGGSVLASATFHRSQPSSNGSRTSVAWPREWRSWVSAEVR